MAASDLRPYDSPPAETSSSLIRHRPSLHALHLTHHVGPKRLDGVGDPAARGVFEREEAGECVHLVGGGRWVMKCIVLLLMFLFFVVPRRGQNKSCLLISAT